MIGPKSSWSEANEATRQGAATGVKARGSVSNSTYLIRDLLSNVAPPASSEADGPREISGTELLSRILADLGKAGAPIALSEFNNRFADVPAKTLAAAISDASKYGLIELRKDDQGQIVLTTPGG